jgi:hypothetical protein
MNVGNGWVYLQLQDGKWSGSAVVGLKDDAGNSFGQVNVVDLSTILSPEQQALLEEVQGALSSALREHVEYRVGVQIPES